MMTAMRSLLTATVIAGCSLAAAPALAQDTGTTGTPATDVAETPNATPATPAPAPEITITGNVALTTDYRFRGVSLSGGDPAIQGGITVSHKSGFYVGTWSSSLQQDTFDVYGGQELDLFGGWTGELTKGLTFDGGLLYYVYPSGGTGHGNYFEPYASVAGTLGPAKIKLGAAYAWKQKSLPDHFGVDGDNLYLFGNVDVAIPKTPFTISGHLGRANGVQAPTYLVGRHKDEAFDYSVGASATVYGPLSLSVSYIGTGGPSVDSFTDDTVVATLTATF